MSQHQAKINTVKPVYCGHLRLLRKVSAITICLLYSFGFFWHKKTTEIKMEDVFHAIRVNKINKIYFKI